MTDQRIIGLHEMPALEGTVFDGAPIVVTRAERDVFDAVSHVSEAYSEPLPDDFPVDIVEGFHTLSLVDAMSTLVMKFDPDTTYNYNYGVDRVRFMSPVPVGKPLQSQIEVREVDAKGDGYKILRRVTVYVDDIDRPSMVADWWVLVLPQANPDG